MANDKELIKTLFKIAEKQQKIIEKLAQQVAPAPAPKATQEDFQALLDSFKTRPEEQATKISSFEALSDGSYDVKIEGFYESMSKFVRAAADKWAGGDVQKIRAVRSASFSGKPGWVGK
jgi:hypothetical protein